MTNEATIIELLGEPEGCGLSFDCASGTAITKGTLMMISGNRIAIASDNTNNIFAGIAGADKESTDGKTKITCLTKGIFGMVVCGTNATQGAWVSLSGANLIKNATEAELAAGKGIGKIIGGTPTAGGTAQVAVGIY